jgi:hypothetical protein
MQALIVVLDGVTVNVDFAKGGLYALVAGVVSLATLWMRHRNSASLIRARIKGKSTMARREAPNRRRSRRRKQGKRYVHLRNIGRIGGERS